MRSQAGFRPADGARRARPAGESGLGAYGLRGEDICSPMIVPGAKPGSAGDRTAARRTRRTDRGTHGDRRDLSEIDHRIALVGRADLAQPAQDV
ncbi:MAG: hypothetical protein Kow0062_02520 [Acidobacteriota bacterium]